MSYSQKIFSLEEGFKCFWIIRDFIKCRQNEGLILKSPKFKVDMLLESKWHLETEIFDTYFDAFLYKNQGLSINSNIHFAVYIYTSKGWKIVLEDLLYKFQTNGSGNGVNLQWDTIWNGSLILCFHLWNGRAKGIAAQSVMQSNMINEKEIFHLPFQLFSALTPSDFIECLSNSLSKVDLKVETRDNSIQTEEEEDLNRFNDLDDLLRLFKEKKFRYVILRTQSKEFAIQKALLCARSPVFNAMFDRDMKENETNIVDIEDIDSDTLSLLLQFLHLEPLGHLKWDSAVRLFYAADKYQIMQLKSECISSLKKELTEENICDALVLADMHHEGELMQRALEFFCKNSKSIIRLPDWKKLTLNRTELASEILCKMAEMLLS